MASLLVTAALAGGQTPQPAQQQTSPAPQTTSPASQTTAAPPRGEVLFQSHGEPPTSPQTSAAPNPAATTPPADKATQPTGPPLTDTQRSAILFTAYDLDARLTPATARLSMRARLTLRNIGTEPLDRIALQVSSTLQWESASLVPAGNAAPVKLPLAQHLIDTDADHTGKANEAILTLPSPLAPGGSIRLDTFYAGPIAASGFRLERIGAGPEQALASDWDAIGAAAAGSSSAGPEQQQHSLEPTLDAALRGFGDVLWYPVAEPQLFLGDGAELFQAIERTRLREQNAIIHLRVSVEYQGDPPAAVYFCGRRQPLVALPDDPDAPVVTGNGIARAEFSSEPIGFRLPSLFVVDEPESMIAPLPGGSGSLPGGASMQTSGAPKAAGEAPKPAGGPILADGPPASSSSSVSSSAASVLAPAGSGSTPMLAVETADDGALPRLADSAEAVAPLLQRWFGARPLTALTILDQPGQPFEDGPLLVAPIASLSTSGDAGALVHSLTHAWVQTGQPWMDEGLAEFVSLLWTEQQKGREAAIAQMDDLVQPLALAEPDFARSAAPTANAPSAGSPPASSSSSSASQTQGTEPVGEPLISSGQAFYYRVKAAAVWWMLRDMAGDDPLRQALSAWRTQPVSHDSAREQAEGFERLLEKTSGKDLGWFFDDWVLRDRGLPDLSIVDVTPRELPAGQGHDTGWLVAVTVHNSGAAAAEVPVIVRSGGFSVTHRLRIAGFSDATERIVVESPPSQVVVNDGSVPEVGSSTHTLTIVQKAQQ